MKSFITGIAGQTASYLSEYLLEQGHEVFGMIRRNSTPEHQESRISHLEDKITTFYGDMTDASSLEKILKEVKPDMIFNLAAQSHVRISFDIPVYTFQVNALGTLNLLEAYKSICPEAKFIQASSSEMFGNSADSDGFQRESTPMNPVSPYGCSKVAAYNLVKHYRNAHKLKAYNYICFNHESPRRGSNFVTNKVVKAAVRIKLGLQHKLEMGNINSFRDWGHAKDYAKAIYKIISLDDSCDLVVATGETRSVGDMCNYVFSQLGMDYTNYVISNPKFLRPEELKYLKGDCSKFKSITEWKPEYTFNMLMDEMIEHWMHYYELKGISA